MNTRRSFLKGFLATAAIVATGSLARVAEDVLRHSHWRDAAIKIDGINLMLIEEAGRITESMYARMLKPSPWGLIF